MASTMEAYKTCIALPNYGCKAFNTNYYYKFHWPLNTPTPDNFASNWGTGVLTQCYGLYARTAITRELVSMFAPTDQSMHWHWHPSGRPWLSCPDKIQNCLSLHVTACTARSDANLTCAVTDLTDVHTP